MGAVLDRLEELKNNMTYPNISIDLTNPDKIFEKSNEISEGLIGLSIISTIAAFMLFVLITKFDWNFIKANLLVGSISTTLAIFYIAVGGFTDYRHFLWIGSHVFVFVMAGLMYKLNKQGE